MLDLDMIFDDDGGDAVVTADAETEPQSLTAAAMQMGGSGVGRERSEASNSNRPKDLDLQPQVSRTYSDDVDRRVIDAVEDSPASCRAVHRFGPPPYRVAGDETLAGRARRLQQQAKRTGKLRPGESWVDFAG